MGRYSTAGMVLEEEAFLNTQNMHNAGNEDRLGQRQMEESRSSSWSKAAQSSVARPKQIKKNKKQKTKNSICCAKKSANSATMRWPLKKVLGGWGFRRKIILGHAV